ncbi:MAG: ABC transporter permease [Inquilinaceae bacterium]
MTEDQGGLRRFFKSWEFGLIVFMVALYLVGVAINPRFFGDTTAVHSILRDAARFGVMAVGMTFVIVNKDLDLSVGSTLGLTATLFSLFFSPNFADLPAWTAVSLCLAAGIGIGLINGVLVTVLRVPAFIATLTMLFIGRGFVLGLTGGKTIAYDQKALDYGFFAIGESNRFDFNNQILVFLVVAVIGAVVLARTIWGYETYATGGNEQAAGYAGINTTMVRIRAFVISSLCATIAGLMNVAQDKGVTSQYGLGSELIVIAAVIVGGASILGGRGRVAGSCLGAILIVLIDKVLREGVPITRTITIGDVEMEVPGMAQMPPGAVPAFLGLILVAAVLIEPWIIRQRLIHRLLARLRGIRIPPPATETVAIEGAKTHGTALSAAEFSATGIRRWLMRREAAAVLFMIVLWGIGFYLRPDFWGSLDNSFNLLLAFTEIGIMAVGMTYVIANGDIDLSVGAVLALSGSTAAYLMKFQEVDPWLAVVVAFLAGTLAGVINGLLTTRARLPAFVATLGMFYIARGIAAWLVAGRQLSQFPDGFTLIGRKFIEVLRVIDMAPAPGTLLFNVASAVSTQTILLAVLATVAGVILARTTYGYMVLATGGNRRAAGYAGIDTDRVRFTSMVFCSMCAAVAGIVYIAYFRSFNPSAGQLRELDVIASVIIGGGSIFGGFGTVIGSLAGAAVITLIRALLSLQIIGADGQSFIMPQHWVNVFIGGILIVAVLADIWIRQEGIFRRMIGSLRKSASGPSQPRQVPP